MEFGISRDEFLLFYTSNITDKKHLDALGLDEKKYWNIIKHYLYYWNMYIVEKKPENQWLKFIEEFTAPGKSFKKLLNL